MRMQKARQPVRQWCVGIAALAVLSQAFSAAQTVGLVQSVRETIARQDFASG